MDLRDGDHRTVEARLRKLERANRGLALALVVAVGLAMLAGATLAPGDKLRVKSVQIVDDAGAVRAAFGLFESGNPTLNMFAGTADMRVQLTYDPKRGPLLQLLGTTPQTKSVMNVTPADEASLALTSRDSLVMAARAGGGSAIAIFDGDKTPRFSAGINPDGSSVRPIPEKMPARDR